MTIIPLRQPLAETIPLLRCDHCHSPADVLFTVAGEDVCGDCVSDASGVFPKIERTES